MNCFADEQMEIQFAFQRTQFAAFSAVQDRLADAESPAKSGDNSSNRSDLHLPRSVAHQKHAARANFALDRSPPVVDRDSRALKTERREPALFHEAFETLARFLPI